MSRHAVSAIYVGAQFLASFAIVVLIARVSAPGPLAGFFLFQAVFFPLTTLISQSRMLMRFRGAEPSPARTIAFDIALTLAAALLLSLLGRTLFTPLTALIYALAIPLSYRGAQALVELQFTDPRLSRTIIPIATALLRILAAGATLPLGAEVSFLVAAVVFLAVPSFARPKARPKAPTPQPADTWIFLGFFTISALTFQWDRLIFSQSGATALIAASGVCMMWMLSPLSTLFATTFRADATRIYAGAPQKPDRAQWARQAKSFALLGTGWIATTALLWAPLTAQLFPFFEGPVLWPLLLGFAILLDRIANLGLFLMNDPAAFAGTAKRKAVAIALAAALIAALAALGHAPSLALAYALMLALSLDHLAAVARRFR